MCLSTESVKEITSFFTKALSEILALKEVSKDLVGFLQKKKKKKRLLGLVVSIKR